MIKEGLWCTRCGTQEFKKHLDLKHPKESNYSSWECIHCGAGYQDNPGYGYFTAWPGEDYKQVYSPNTGLLIDPNKGWRTPEGIVRHSSTRDSLEKYLRETQV